MADGSSTTTTDLIGRDTRRVYVKATGQTGPLNRSPGPLWDAGYAAGVADMEAKYKALVVAASFNEKTHDHFAYIRSQLPTRNKWLKSDYVEFYDRDVTYLLDFSENVKQALRQLGEPHA